MEQEIGQHEEQLVQKFSLAKNRLAKNQLVWIAIINFIIFFSFIFAVAYYKWARVSFVFHKNTFSEKEIHFWVNLLYVKEDVDGSSYESFSTFDERICDQDLYCSAVIYQFQFVGSISFSIFCIAGCLQLEDFIIMIFYVWKSGKIFQSRDKFRHIVIIITYLIGLTLSAFSVGVINPDQSYYGVSFWFFIGILCLFVGVIIYEQISIRKLIKQSLILNLINKQKKIRSEEIHKHSEIHQEEGQLTL